MITRALSFALLLAVSAVVSSQEPPPLDAGSQSVSVQQGSGLVTIASKGQDVRNVLFDLFTQGKKSFVLEPGVRFVLYLALSGVGFDEALDIVCHNAGLQYEVSSGIYYISKGTSTTDPKTKATPIEKPLGKLSDADLQRKLTTKLAKASIREVFAEFSRQTGIPIEVEKKVPDYKVDAFLVDTSLKYALDVMTKAAGLVYVRTDNRTLRVETKAKA